MGRVMPLLLVAAVAGHHDVFPVGLSALGLGNHMVVGQPAKAMADAAVLTLEVVAHRDVDSGELDRSLAPHDRAQEPHHCRHLNCDADGTNILVVLLDNLDFAIENHADGALPTDNSMGLIALV